MPRQFRSRGHGQGSYPLTPRKSPKVRSNQRRSSLNNLPSAGIKHQGSLTELGYNLEEDDGKRSAAVLRAWRKYGYTESERKLVELETLNKNHPEKRAKVRRDLDTLAYIQYHYLLNTHKIDEAAKFGGDHSHQIVLATNRSSKRMDAIAVSRG